jgi:hypothetical protein
LPVDHAGAGETGLMLAPALETVEPDRRGWTRHWYAATAPRATTATGNRGSSSRSSNGRSIAKNPLMPRPAKVARVVAAPRVFRKTLGKILPRILRRHRHFTAPAAMPLMM